MPFVFVWARHYVCVSPQSVGVSRSPDRQWPMRSLRCRLFSGAFKVRSLPWLVFACLTVQVQRFIAQMHQLYVAPLFCFSQVGCKEDQGETENQQSSVWRGFLFWGISIFFFFVPLMERFAQSFLSAPTCNSTIRQRPEGFLALFKFANPLAQPGITHSCPSFRSWLKEVASQDYFYI